MNKSQKAKFWLRFWGEMVVVALRSVHVRIFVWAGAISEAKIRKKFRSDSQIAFQLHAVLIDFPFFQKIKTFPNGRQEEY